MHSAVFYFVFLPNLLYGHPVYSAEIHKSQTAESHKHTSHPETVGPAKYPVIRIVCVLAVINAPLEAQCQIIKIDADMQCSEVCACVCVCVYAGLFVLFLSEGSNQM